MKNNTDTNKNAATAKKTQLQEITEQMKQEEAQAAAAAATAANTEATDKNNACGVQNSPLYKMGLKVAELEQQQNKRALAINAVLEDMQAISKEKNSPELRHIKMRPITESYLSALQDMVDRTLNKPHSADVDGLDLNADALYNLHDRAAYMKLEFNEQDVDRMIYNILKRVTAIALANIEDAEDFMNFTNELQSISDMSYEELMKAPKYSPVTETKE